MSRATITLLATAVLGGVAMSAPLGAVTATAAPDPCAASQVAKTIGVVATNTGSYLDAHPQTNQALTAISQQQPGPQTLVALKNYFDVDPQAAKDLQAIQQPLTGLSAQCKLPVSVPQLLGVLQGAQPSPGTQSGASPGATPAQTVAGGASTPGLATPAAAVPANGPLPGPSAAITR